MCMRGDIYCVELKSYEKHVQKGKRPVLVISNNKNNFNSPVVTVVPFTSVTKKMDLDTHVVIYKSFGLRLDSMALGEQIMPIDKSRLTEGNLIGYIDDKRLLEKIKEACICQIS